MSDTRVGRTPRSDAEWARETERRLRALERARTARAGEYVLSSRDGRLVATKPGETPLEVGQVPAPVEIDLSARGSVVSDITAIATAVGYPEVDEEDPPSLDDVRQWVLQQLFGKIPPSRIPGLPWAHLFDGAEELLDDPSFDNPSTFANNPSIIYDPDFGRLKPGSARIDADGTTKTAVSNLISVAAGEVMPMSVHVFYEGVTATGADPIQMVVRGYHVEEDGTRTLVDTQLIDAVSAPSGESDDVPEAEDGWLRLSGSYTVPELAESVDEIVMEISVTADLTAGTVWFDDGSVTKTRDGMPQSWILNLPTDLNSLWNGLGSLVDQILTRLGITPVGSLLDRIFDLSDELEWIQEKAQEGALGAAQAIQDVVGLAQSLLTDPASVIGQLLPSKIGGVDVFPTIEDTINGIKDSLWSGFRRTQGSDKSMADVQAAAWDLAASAEAAENTSHYLTSLLTMPRHSPRWESTGPQDAVAFPIINATATYTPTLGELILIPVTAEESRPYQSIKFGMLDQGMTALAVGVYRYNDGILEREVYLPEAKDRLLGGSIQAINLDEPLYATRGETLYIGVLQVGGTASPMHAAPYPGGIVESSQEIPNWIGSRRQAISNTFPKTLPINTVVEMVPVWGALGAETGDQVVPPPVSYADNFNRPDGPLGLPWVPYGGTPMAAIENNQITISGSAGTRCAAVYSLGFTTQRQRVSVDRMYHTGWDGVTALSLRYKDPQNFMAAVVVDGLSNHTLQIRTMIDGTEVTRATQGYNEDLPAAGAAMVFETQGNMYRASCCGKHEVYWTDTGNLFPSTNMAYNRAMFQMINGSTVFGGASGRLDNFEMKDW